MGPDKYTLGSSTILLVEGWIVEGSQKCKQERKLVLRVGGEGVHVDSSLSYP